MNISASSYGLVFGFNTFLALAFQTVLTMVVADDIGLALPPREQVPGLKIFKIKKCATFLSSGLP